MIDTQYGVVRLSCKAGVLAGIGARWVGLPALFWVLVLGSALGFVVGMMVLSHRFGDGETRQVVVAHRGRGSTLLALESADRVWRAEGRATLGIWLGIASLFVSAFLHLVL